jgi:hypothetical protein
MRFSSPAAGLLLAAAIAVPAWAAGDPQPPGKKPSQEALQRQKTENCDADAAVKGLQGEARNRFMDQCLKGSTAGSAMKAAPTKEQACMSQADDKKLAGPARSSFIQGCLGR